MTTLFVVMKCGIYFGECAGIFSTAELARDAAFTLIKLEKDDYHTYYVLPYELDKAVLINPDLNLSFSDLVIPKPAFSIMRTDANGEANIEITKPV